MALRDYETEARDPRNSTDADGVITADDWVNAVGSALDGVSVDLPDGGTMTVTRAGTGSSTGNEAE